MNEKHTDKILAHCVPSPGTICKNPATFNVWFEGCQGLYGFMCDEHVAKAITDGVNGYRVYQITALEPDSQYPIPVSIQGKNEIEKYIVFTASFSFECDVCHDKWRDILCPEEIPTRLPIFIICHNCRNIVMINGENDETKWIKRNYENYREIWRYEEYIRDIQKSIKRP